MNGSGCMNCPVKPCETMNYRGSTCAAQRAKLGLGDPMTNADRIRAMSDKELAFFLADEIPHGDCYGCELDCSCDSPWINEGCRNAFYKWLRQPAEVE